ncbi:hypothetical protein SprV_0100057500 [Sparganum proliferum]
MFAQSRADLFAGFTNITGLTAITVYPVNDSRFLIYGNRVLRLHELPADRYFRKLRPEHIQVLKHTAGFNTLDANPANLVPTIESVLKRSQEPVETQHLIRQQVTSLVMTHKPWMVIPRAQQDALRVLKAAKSIVILPADKGRPTVILDKTEYLQKANALLEDMQACVMCNGDPMKKLMTQINTTLIML